MERTDDGLEKTISAIENSHFDNIGRNSTSEEEAFELWKDPVLLLNLEGNMGTLFVRAFLNKLSINEHRVLQWRVDHKYVQYQILNYYAPDCMAETLSLSQLLDENKGAQKIKELCENGFFIKAALGDSSGRANCFDRTNEIDDIIRLHQQENNKQEKWILQKRLDLKEEYRIHTFGRDILYGLTFLTEGWNYLNRLQAEEFTRKTLEKLPDTIVQGTLIGWDIGITNTNEYYMIEANITGFHPEFTPGFQTSGFFGDAYYGPVLCAWLNSYFKNKYRISIGSIESSLRSANNFYEEFLYYVSILKDEYLEILRDRAKGINRTIILYLGDDMDSRLIKFLKYLTTQDLSDQYYLIVNQEYLLTGIDEFEDEDATRVIADRTLFSEDEYLLIRKLSYEEQKAACCQNLVEILKEKSYFII